MPSFTSTLKFGVDFLTRPTQKGIRLMDEVNVLPPGRLEEYIWGPKKGQLQATMHMRRQAEVGKHPFPLPISIRRRPRGLLQLTSGL